MLVGNSDILWLAQASLSVIIQVHPPELPAGCTQHVDQLTIKIYLNFWRSSAPKKHVGEKCTMHHHAIFKQKCGKTPSVSPLNPCDPHFVVRNFSTLGTAGHEAFHLSTNREHLVHPLVWGFLWVARRRKSWKFQRSPHQNGVAFGGLKWLVGLFVGMIGNKVFTINRVVAWSIFMFLKSRIPLQKSWSVFMGCLVFYWETLGKKWG